MARRLGRREYVKGAEAMAVGLLGCTLVRTTDSGARLAGVIVETEAYVGAMDRASHAFGGRRTPRNESMYARPGTAYVYFTYGMHHCFNVVCGAKDEPVAVLIRALEPVDGLDEMRRNREGKGRGVRDTDLCSGPAKLCQAMKIDRDLDGADLTTGRVLHIEGGALGQALGRDIGSGPRVGLGEVGEWGRAALRWWIKGNPHVSR